MHTDEVKAAEPCSIDYNSSILQKKHPWGSRASPSSTNFFLSLQSAERPPHLKVFHDHPGWMDYVNQESLHKLQMNSRDFKSKWNWWHTMMRSSSLICFHRDEETVTVDHLTPPSPKQWLVQTDTLMMGKMCMWVPETSIKSVRNALQLSSWQALQCGEENIAWSVYAHLYNLLWT